MITLIEEPIQKYAEVTDYVANGSFASLKKNVKVKDEVDYGVLLRLTDHSRKWKGPFKYVNKESFDFLSKSKVVPGDLIIANVGSAGTCFLAPALGKPMTLGPNAILVKSEISDYLYYYFNSPVGRHKLNSIIGGVAQPKFNKTDFRGLKISVFESDERARVVDILSSLDYKIELNRKINDILEEIGQTLFRHWFVDFEFPWDFKKNEFLWNGKPYKSSGGEMVESELGEIPKGWAVNIAKNVTSDLSRGPSIKYTELSGGVPVLNQRCIRNGEIDLEAVRYAEKLNENKEHLYLHLNDILINSMGEGTLGRISRNMSIEYPIIIHNCITLVRADLEKISSHVLFYFIKSQERNFVNLGEGTSGQTSLKIDIVKQTKILVPTINLQKAFDEIVEQAILQYGLFKNQNLILSQIRDFLLPRLMSGKLRVPINK